MMYYTPGTVLSYAGYREECIVITGGDVMVTRTHDKECRKRMKLIDWLITAQGGESVIPHETLTADEIWKNAVKNSKNIEETPIADIEDEVIDQSLYDDRSSISSFSSTSSTDDEYDFNICGCRR